MAVCVVLVPGQDLTCRVPIETEKSQRLHLRGAGAAGTRSADEPGGENSYSGRKMFLVLEKLKGGTFFCSGSSFPWGRSDCR